MSNLIRLGLAVLLAGAAGFCNFMWLESQDAKYPSFVVAATNIDAGDSIQKTHLGSRKVPGDLKELRQTFIPSPGGRPLLLGTRAPQDYKQGDFILQSHVENEVPHWRALGPFRLVSVGDRVLEGGRYSDGDGTNTITVAAEVDSQGGYDAKTQRLLDLIAEQSNPRQGKSIVTVQVHPDTENELNADETTGLTSSGGRLPLGDNERGILVPLAGIVSVPEILTRGTKVSLVIQWFPDPYQAKSSFIPKKP